MPEPDHLGQSVSLAPICLRPPIPPPSTGCRPGTGPDPNRTRFGANSWPTSAYCATSLTCQFNLYTIARWTRLFFYVYHLIQHISYSHSMLIFSNNGNIGILKLSIMRFDTVLANSIDRLFLLILSQFGIQHLVKGILNLLFKNVVLCRSDQNWYCGN